MMADKKDIRHMMLGMVDMIFPTEEDPSPDVKVPDQTEKSDAEVILQNIRFAKRKFKDFLHLTKKTKCKCFFL